MANSDESRWTATDYFAAVVCVALAIIVVIGFAKCTMEVERDICTSMLAHARTHADSVAVYTAVPDGRGRACAVYLK